MATPTGPTVLQAVRNAVLAAVGNYTYNRVWDQGPPEDVPAQYLPAAMVEDGGADFKFTTENNAEDRRVTVAILSKTQENAESILAIVVAALTTTSYPNIMTPAPPPFAVNGASLTYSKPSSARVENAAKMDVAQGKMVKRAAQTFRIRVTRPSA